MWLTRLGGGVVALALLAAFTMDVMEFGELVFGLILAGQVIGVAGALIEWRQRKVQWRRRLP
jgi:uncharacterized membrane protein YccC